MKVFVLIDETSMFPIFSSREAARPYLEHCGYKEETVEAVVADTLMDYPQLREVEVDSWEGGQDR